MLSLAECALLATLVWLLAAWGKTASWIPGTDLLFAAMVLVFARDGGIVSRALSWRPLIALGQLSFAIYMVHLFFVQLTDRFLPRLFAATGHGEWIVGTGPHRHRFGLDSVDPPAWLATLITLAITLMVLAAAWLAWRYIEEPARQWSRRFAPPSGGPPVAAI